MLAWCPTLQHPKTRYFFSDNKRSDFLLGAYYFCITAFQTAPLFSVFMIFNLFPGSDLLIIIPHPSCSLKKSILAMSPTVICGKPSGVDGSIIIDHVLPWSFVFRTTG